MDNKSYLEKLKGEKEYFEFENETVFEYPNIQNLNIENNYLIYGTYRLNLNGIDLYLLDPSLFKLSINEILFAIKNMVINHQDPSFIEKEIKYMEYLQSLTNLDDEKKKYIFKYLDDFYKKQKLNKRFIDNDLQNEINGRIIPISAAYLNEEDQNSNYHRPASIYIRELEVAYSEAQRNSAGHAYKGPVLVRTNDSITPTSFDVDSWQEAGFTNTLIAVGTTIALGIGLAILLFLK